MSSSTTVPTLISNNRLRSNSTKEALIEARNRFGVQDIRSLLKRERLPGVPKEVKLNYNRKRGSTSSKASFAELYAANFVENLPKALGNYVVITGWKLEKGTQFATEIDVCVIHPTKGMIFLEVGTTKHKGEKKVNLDQADKARIILLDRYVDKIGNKQDADKIFNSFVCSTVLTNTEPKQGKTMPNATSIILYREDFNQDSFDKKVTFGTIPDHSSMDLYDNDVYEFLITQYFLDTAFMPLKDAEETPDGDLTSQKFGKITNMVDEVRDRGNVVDEGKTKLLIKPLYTPSRPMKGLYLSANPCSILHLDEKRLHIEGTAGTGKTLLLYQKMRQCLDRDEKCLFMVGRNDYTILEKTRQVFSNWGYRDEEKLKIMDFASFKRRFSLVFKDLTNLCNDTTLSQSDFLSEWRSFHVVIDELRPTYTIDAKSGYAIKFVYVLCEHYDKCLLYANDSAQNGEIQNHTSGLLSVSLNGAYRSPANFFPLIEWEYRRNIEASRKSSTAQEEMLSLPWPRLAHRVVSKLTPKYVVVVGAKDEPSTADSYKQIVEKQKKLLDRYEPSQFAIFTFGLSDYTSAEIASSGYENTLVYSETYTRDAKAKLL